MFRKIGIFKNENKIEREYSYEEMLQIQAKKRKKQIALAITISLSIVFYLAWTEVSTKMEAKEQVRLLGEKLIDIRLKSSQNRGAISIVLGKQGNWLAKEHAPQKSCEGEGRENIFFESKKNMLWKAFLSKKGVEKEEAKREISDFCLDAKQGILIQQKVLEPSHLLSIVAYLKKKDKLEAIQEILIQEGGANILIRDFVTSR